MRTVLSEMPYFSANVPTEMYFISLVYRQVLVPISYANIVFLAVIGKILIFFVVYIKLAPDINTEGFVKIM